MSTAIDPISDDQLMHDTARGDREAFRRLVRRHQGVVTRFACRLLNGDRAAAEDIGQEAFLRLYRSAGAYVGSGEIRAFLLTVTRNLCRDYLRRHRPTETLDAADPAPSGDSALLSGERADAVRSAIGTLSEESIEPCSSFRTTSGFRMSR